MTQKEFWNKRASYFHENMKAGVEQEYFLKLMTFLEDSQMLVPNTHVLDIGCGPGKYALEFAKKGCAVTLTDISDRMLEFAEESLSAIPVKKHFIELDWNDVSVEAMNWKKSFDLVFASMSPAIGSMESIEKMCSVAKSNCFISKFAYRRDIMKIRIEKETGIILTNEKAIHDSYTEILDHIKALGYSAETHYEDFSWENLFTPQEGAERIIQDYSLRNTITPDIEERIKKSALNIADENGIIHDTVQARAIWICWNVAEQRFF